MADDPARLAGRRGHRAARRGGACWRCASAAARAVQAVFDAFGFPPITEEEVAAATAGYRLARPARPRPSRRRRRRRPRPRARRLGRSTSRARSTARLRRRGRGGVRDAAPARCGRLPPDLGDHRAPTAPCARPSTTRTPTRGRAPATGSRASAGSGCRRCRTRSTRACSGRRDGVSRDRRSKSTLLPSRRRPGRGRDRGRAGVRRRAPRDDQRPRPRGRAAELVDGCPGGGCASRGSCACAARRDVAFIGHDGARLSGSGVAVGLQSKGTALIHRADLEPLDNLELFGMAPSLTLESYRAIGRNAAGYALGRASRPCRRCSTTSPARS